MTFASGPLTDWTNGTGVFPAGGSITVTANTERQWFYVQARDVGGCVVNYPATAVTSGATTTAQIALNGASASGLGGGTEDRSVQDFEPAGGQIVITGTAGQKVTIVTG